MAERRTPSIEEKASRTDIIDGDNSPLNDQEPKECDIISFLDGIDSVRFRSPVQIQRPRRLKALCIGIRDMFVFRTFSFPMDTLSPR